MEEECLVCGGYSSPEEYITKDTNINLSLCEICKDEAQNAEITVFKKCKVEIAHHIPGHLKCGNTHGHSVTIIVGVKGCMNLDTGMVMDFHSLKEIIKKEVVDRFDHKYVNDILPIPTAEFMAFYLFKKLEQRGIGIVSIRVQETENNYVEYSGEPGFDISDLDPIEQGEYLNV
jgi:6-pyruvoyltetrahydropterin/6-carboxytetrahydropterin synthase